MLEEVAPEVDAVANELERLTPNVARAGVTGILDVCRRARLDVDCGQLPVLRRVRCSNRWRRTESDRRARRHEADRLDVLAETRTPNNAGRTRWSPLSRRTPMHFAAEAIWVNRRNRELRAGAKPRSCLASERMVIVRVAMGLAGWAWGLGARFDTR